MKYCAASVLFRFQRKKSPNKNKTANVNYDLD